MFRVCQGFRAALSNPFATCHMWRMSIKMCRMALYPGTSKTSYFGLNRAKFKIFPYVVINISKDVNFLKKMANEVIIVKTLVHISHKRF